MVSSYSKFFFSIDYSLSKFTKIIIMAFKPITIAKIINVLIFFPSMIKKRPLAVILEKYLEINKKVYF
jgi:hypothetical protein